MIYFWVKAAVSGLLIAAISEIARRSPGVAALVASLPILSILGVIWLWRDTGDVVRVGDHLSATFWLVLPSLPMFLLVPALLRGNMGFWLSLLGGCVLTVCLYLILLGLGPRFGLRL